MLKLFTLGLLGYVAYRYINRQKTRPAAIPLAGGRLSDNAHLQHSPAMPAKS